MWEEFYLYGPSGGEHWRVWYSSEPTVCVCNWYVEYARLLCRVTKSDFKSFSHFKPVNGKSTSSIPKMKMSVSVSVNCVVQLLSCDRLFPILQIVACQAPLSMGFPRQEYWSGLPCPPPGDLPKPGIKLRSPALQAVSCTASGFFTNWATKPPEKPEYVKVYSLITLQYTWN